MKETGRMMEYFLLRQDMRIDNKIPFSDEKESIQLSLGHNIEWIDYYEKRNMMESTFFISEKMKKVFETYETDINFSPIMVEKKKYWKITMKPIEEAMYGNFEKAEDMKLIEDVIKNRNVIMVQYRKRDYIVVNLYVAESMLRQYMLGIKYVKIQNEVRH